MGTITGLTAERMLEIEAASVVDGDVVGTDLFLTRKDGSVINAGSVRGPAGPTGPMGSALAVVSALPVSEIGVSGHIRAGRRLTLADFTNVGLAAPVGLYNLSDLTDTSGNGRTLTNKGAVPFGVGMAGGAASAAVFAGSTNQGLYIPDAGGADPFRIATGAFGCWFRTARRVTAQSLITKFDDTVAGRRSWALSVNANKASVAVSSDGAAATVVGLGGTSDIADDRWHFMVATVDGTRVRVYVDGVLEGTANFQAPLFATPAPFNIGGYNASSSTVATQPHYGRIAEAFVLNEVPSVDQIRYLMAASIPHALGVVPSTVRVLHRRKKRGAPMATTDFPAQPLRLYNVVNGSLADQGSQNIPLALGAGTDVTVDGPDGKLGAKHGASAATYFFTTDTGLPSGLSPRSFGVWFKTNLAQNAQILAWGNAGIIRTNVSGQIGSDSGADLLGFVTVVSDGLWHHVVVVEDNAAADGMKRKLYLDGKVESVSTVMNSLTLSGAAGFRFMNGFQGQVSRGFVFGGVLTPEQVRALYNISAQAMAPKPRSSSDFIEAVESGRLLGIFTTIEASDSVDLMVMA